MKDHPIIFSAPMILALLAGRKTMTRRLAWGKPVGIDVDEEAARDLRHDGWKVSDDTEHRIAWRRSPWQRVQPGAKLWVRESLVYETGMWWYAADKERVALVPPNVAAGTAWAHHYSRDKAPSIYMPRACSRLTLTVTATKIERLQEITDADVRAEGVPQAAIDKWGKWLHPNDCPGKAFGEIWDALHGNGAWDENPEVVALSFTVHKQNIDAIEREAA